MRMALDEAESALRAGEFPVGCIITDGGEVVASGRRAASRGALENEIDHAEILALRKLYRSRPDIGKDRLCLYSTLEPCLMCFGAILISGIRRIVYAFEDVMGGGTSLPLQAMPPLYRDMDPAVVASVCRDESLALMRAFFSNPDNGYLKDTHFARYVMSKEHASGK